MVANFPPSIIFGTPCLIIFQMAELWPSYTTQDLSQALQALVSSQEPRLQKQDPIYYCCQKSHYHPRMITSRGMVPFLVFVL